MAYCSSRFRTIRRATREVSIGRVQTGGGQPIRIQSMTTSDTQDVDATVRQSIALAEVGCEIVRVTAPNIAAARCLREIRARFSAAGFEHVPLVADIHFLPSAAMEAVEHVEKIRVNPGNYADKKRFAVREYSDADYENELERLHTSFSPLVKRCRELGRAMRIGTNHGSLSDRIMNRYGDTPLGMVESALEFIRIAESHDFHDIVLSMKASNPKVMIQAYRLLVERMDAEDMRYPLHLGVTEAGDGEDGRIKSAIGIGSLLLDGLGDTIRVSLTEDSVYEIPVAQALARKVMRLWDGAPRSIPETSSEVDRLDPYRFSRRSVSPVALSPEVLIEAEQPPRVIVPAGKGSPDMRTLGAKLQSAQPALKDTPVEGLVVTADQPEDVARVIQGAHHLRGLVASLLIEAPSTVDIGSLQPPADGPRIGLVRSFEDGELNQVGDFIKTCTARGILPIVAVGAASVDALAASVSASSSGVWMATLSVRPRGWPAPGHAVGAWRQLIEALDKRGLKVPVWIRNTAATAIDDQPGFLSRLLESSILTGALLCDGIGDAVSIETEPDLARATRLAYNTLQGAGARISKTEFVACPSCGRTLFDLQSTTKRIREKTGHLKGVKIAIMGCIVNGPGEMADADFGYVGGAPGRINLYVGKDCVQYNIPQVDADERLIVLIREHGKWTDPEPAEASARQP